MRTGSSVCAVAASRRDVRGQTPYYLLRSRAGAFRNSQSGKYLGCCQYGTTPLLGTKPLGMARGQHFTHPLLYPPGWRGAYLGVRFNSGFHWSNALRSHTPNSFCQCPWDAMIPVPHHSTTQSASDSWQSCFQCLCFISATKHRAAMLSDSEKTANILFGPTQYGKSSFLDKILKTGTEKQEIVRPQIGTGRGESTTRSSHLYRDSLIGPTIDVPGIHDTGLLVDSNSRLRCCLQSKALSEFASLYLIV